MANYEWSAVELWDSSDCSSDCSSHSLSSMGEEAYDMPMLAPRVSFCSTLDAPPSNSAPSSLGTRVKGVLKAPRYKVCQVQMQQNLELFGMMSTMSMDLSLSERSNDEDNQGGRVDLDDFSYGSNGSDDDDDRSVATVDDEDGGSITAAELHARGGNSGYSDYGANDSLLLYKNNDEDKVALNRGTAAADAHATTIAHISSNPPPHPCHPRRPEMDDAVHSPRRHISSSAVATAAAAAATAVADFSRSMDDICRGVRRRTRGNGKIGARRHEHETPADFWRSVDDVHRGGRGSGPENQGEEHGSPGPHDDRGIRRPHFQLRKKKGFGYGWKSLMRAFPSAMDEMWRIGRHNKDKGRGKYKDKDKDKDKDKSERGEEGGDEYLSHLNFAEI